MQKEVWWWKNWSPSKKKKTMPLLQQPISTKGIFGPQDKKENKKLPRKIGVGQQQCHFKEQEVKLQ